MKTAVAAVALLLTAVPAAAKSDPTTADLCGRSSCRTVTDRAVLAALKPWDRPTADPPPPARYLTIGPASRASFGNLFYVPSAGMLASARRGQLVTGESYVVWFRLTTRERALLAGATRGLRPHPVPPIAEVRIDGRTVRGAAAASYARLWRESGRRVPDAPKPCWTIDLRSYPQTPWTIERAELAYAPAANVLERGRSLIRLDDALAADLEAARALR